MVQKNKSKKRKKLKKKGFRENAARSKKINASTPNDTFSEQLNPFGRF